MKKIACFHKKSFKNLFFFFLFFARDNTCVTTMKSRTLAVERIEMCLFGSYIPCFSDRKTINLKMKRNINYFRIHCCQKHHSILLLAEMWPAKIKNSLQPGKQGFGIISSLLPTIIFLKFLNDVCILRNNHNYIP